MATGNNFMSGPAQAYANRTLPSDQQSMQDGLAMNAQAATDVANLAVGARDATRIGVGTANFGSKLLTGKNLVNGAMMANRFNVPVLTYTLADFGVKEARNAMGYTDGKGLSDLIGDSLGGYIGNKLYGAQNERLSKPFTQEELDAYKANMGKPPSQAPATAGLAGSISGNSPSTSPTIIDSDPLTEKAREEFLAEKQQYDFDNATVVDSDPLTPQQLEKFQSEMALANAKPTPLIKIDSDPLTPENLQNIQDMKGEETLARMRREGPQNLQEALTEKSNQDMMATMRREGPQNLQEALDANGQMRVGIAPQYGQLSDQQILEQRQLRALGQGGSGGLAEAYGQLGVDPRSLQFAGGGMRPDGVESYSGITQSGNKLPIDRETLEAFQKNQESQKSASGLMRQEFDSTPIISDTPEAGMVSFIDSNGKLTYGNETAKQMYSADAIENTLSERFKAEQALQGTETPLEAPVESLEGSTPSNPPTSPEESPAPAGTPDSEKTEEQLEYERQIAEDDESLMKWARDNNKSPEYVEKMMEGVVERREQAQKEKKLEDLLSELQIEGDQLRNIRLAQQIEEAGLPPEVSMSDVNSLRRMMESMGVSQDGITGNLTVTDEGFWTDTERPLGPTSALFYSLNKTEAGRHILNMTPAEINIVKNPDSSLRYPTKDGRFFTWDDEEQEWNIYLPQPLGLNFNQLDENGLMPDEDQVA